MCHVWTLQGTTWMLVQTEKPTALSKREWDKPTQGGRTMDPKWHYTPHPSSPQRRNLFRGSLAYCGTPKTGLGTYDSSKVTCPACLARLQALGNHGRQA